MRNTILSVIAVVIIASAAYVFFSGTTVAPVTPVKTQPSSNVVVPEDGKLGAEKAAESSAATAVVPPSSGVTVAMTSGNFFFRPNELKVKQGQTVTVVFTNSGFHTFTIDELGVNTPLTGSGGTATFTASKKGTFEYYCAIGSHRAMGMKGTLVVE